MAWHDYFEKVFFEAWQKSGLPHHQPFINEYIEIREHGEYLSDWIRNSTPISSKINGSQLHSVYGFGVTTGKVYASMFGLHDTQTKDSADWCGRFNLGISLFDYICDEMEGLSKVSSLEIFQPFNKVDRYADETLNPAQELLTKLVSSVLDDLRNLGEKKSRKGESDAIFAALKKMYNAELYVSQASLSVTHKLSKIEDALYLKSAEPFNVMAQFTALKGNIIDPRFLENVRRVGVALGYCYWLIDDAKDVWIDLEDGHWNLFLKLAADVEPNFFTDTYDLAIEEQLLRIWEESGLVYKISNQIITDLVKAVDQLNLPAKSAQDAMGLVSASLWQWYKF